MGTNILAMVHLLTEEIHGQYKIRTTGFSYMDHTMIYIYIYILLYLWGPGGPSIVILVPSSFPRNYFTQINIREK